jgi:hypothetical protein
MIATAVARLGEAGFVAAFGTWGDVIDDVLFRSIAEAEAEYRAAEFEALEAALAFIVDDGTGVLKLLLPDVDPASVARAVRRLGWDRDGEPDPA